jgi:hypothetical protein
VYPLLFIKRGAKAYNRNVNILGERRVSIAFLTKSGEKVIRRTIPTPGVAVVYSIIILN